MKAVEAAMDLFTGQAGRSASTSHEGDESHEVRCLTQEMIKGVALEADEGR